MKHDENASKMRVGKVATEGITLRLEVPLLGYYEQVVARANRIRVANGERGNLTVQQVILHRLRSLPAYKAHCEKG